MRRALWQTVDSLAEHHRLVIMLRYLYDLPYKEIAQVLEISEGTVKSRLYTAHRQLRERLAANKMVAGEAAVRVTV